MNELTPQQIRSLEKIKASRERWEKADRRPFLYVIKCEDYYKIGHCSNLDSRLNSLQCGNPFPLEIIYAERLRVAKAIEDEIHIMFTNVGLHHKREWFKLAQKDIDFVKKVVDEVNKKLSELCKK